MGGGQELLQLIPGFLLMREAFVMRGSIAEEDTHRSRG